MHWCNFCQMNHSSVSCYHPANARRFEAGPSAVMFCIDRKQAPQWLWASLRALWRGSQDVRLNADKCGFIYTSSEGADL